MTCQREMTRSLPAVAAVQGIEFGCKDLCEIQDGGSNRIAKALGRSAAARAISLSAELRLRAFESGGIGAWRWNSRSGLVDADEPLQRLWGVPYLHQPQPVSVYTRLLTAEGAASVDAAMASAIAPGQAFDVAVEVADGPKAGCWLQHRGRVDRDYPWLIYGVSFEITGQRLAALKLRQSEAQWRTLIQGIPQLVWRSDEMGRWMWSGPQWRACTGQSLGESLGLGWLEAVHPDDRPAVLRAWMDAATHGAIDVEHRVWQASRDDHVWCRTRAVPMILHEGMVVEWLGTTTEIHQLKELQQRQAVLVGELQHRTRNLIGIIRSSAEKSIARSQTFEEFRASFNDRLAALARVQGLLSHLGDRGCVTFDQLLRSELSGVGGVERAHLDGPEGVALCSSTLQTFALAVHELATNALKYGALAQAQGQLEIRWRLLHDEDEGTPWLHVDWRESGVVMAVGDLPPRGGGSGRELIERALPYQLGAKTTFAFEPDGVHCTIAVLLAPKADVPAPSRAPLLA